MKRSVILEASPERRQLRKSRQFGYSALRCRCSRSCESLGAFDNFRIKHLQQIDRDEPRCMRCRHLQRSPTLGSKTLVIL
mmetsp:Transcript_22575/g.56107  ORF Transcript_22575/g.56107 Transcript_22575/m.56107 type:complete len:80 (-) Transcript_22575:1009-1248(-)